MKRVKKGLLSIVVATALSVLLYAALDNVPRYVSWLTLSLDKLKQDALVYSNGKPVCLYIVDCSTDVARLKLIRNETELDIEKLKSVIWQRRFSNYCEGYTENIVIDIPAASTTEGRRDDARWSFYNDRFITNHGHFQGSAASFYPFEGCTENDVLWGKDS